VKPPADRATGPPECRLLREGERHEVDESPNPSCELMALEIDRVDVGVRRESPRQEVHQPAAAQMAIDVPLCAQRNPAAFRRPVGRSLPLVGRQVIASGPYNLHTPFPRVTTHGEFHEDLRDRNDSG
jgi:hypothetical protein